MCLNVNVQVCACMFVFQCVWVCACLSVFQCEWVGVCMSACVSVHHIKRNKTPRTKLGKTEGRRRMGNRG